MNVGLVICAREGCGHNRTLHPRAAECLQPGCRCIAFVMPLEPPEEPDHDHEWQPAGLLAPVNGHAMIAALCFCGTTARFDVPDAPFRGARQPDA